ncbi:Ig-like domain-containing protein [Niallia endozanthoxylica]|uniref:SbsA Ig-like domain-containing protein n=1 Tax=Niallia endozanthoxylica TaxID=2036016 RepID=A0A5J5H4D4_9BACI|nr:Ig-like domain-containing protein [Niallia endozanthoxylica]KAA9014562.1 hypothetical protein F4V44_23755 [Niallia endozanthoxylica]
MIKKKWRIATILFVFTMLLIMPITTLGSSNDTDVWSTKTISETNKVWTVSFSQPLKESSIKKTTVYIEDERYRLFFTDVALSEDKKSIIVTPKNAYQENITYKLNISKEIMSEKGKKLANNIILPFVLNGTTENGNQEIAKEPISNVTITPLAYASRITAISNDTVNRVTANSKDMHYEGDNTYSLGIIDLSSGDNVRIEAYDIKGKKVFSKDYKVN